MKNLKTLIQYYLLVTEEEFVHKALLATFYRRISKCHCCLMLLLCERCDHLKLRGKCWLQHSHTYIHTYINFIYSPQSSMSYIHTYIHTFIDHFPKGAFQCQLQYHPHYHHHYHHHHHHHNQVQLGQFNKVKEILCVKRLVNTSGKYRKKYEFLFLYASKVITLLSI